MIIIDTPELGFSPLAALRWNTKIGKNHLATIIGAISQVETGLEANKRHREVGTNSESHDATGITVNPGGYIECDNSRAMRVDRGYGQCEFPFDHRVSSPLPSNPSKISSASGSSCPDQADTAPPSALKSP